MNNEPNLKIKTDRHDQNPDNPTLHSELGATVINASNDHQQGEEQTHHASVETKTPIETVIVNECGGERPDIFFSFSGGIGKTRLSGRELYRSLPYSSVSEHGIATGSRTRVIATVAIADAFPDMPIVTNSFNRFDPDEPTMSSVIKAELVDRGVDSERIIEETDSFSTVTQIVEMIKMVTRMNLGREDPIKNVAVMTNEYHLPRMRGMFDRLETIIDDDDFQKTLKEFRDTGVGVHFICAEPVMRAISPKFTTYLERVANTEQYQHTLATEAKGLADLEAGKYRVVLNPEKPRK